MKLTSFAIASCALLALFVSSASAAPLAWEPDFGPEIVGLTGEDDDEELVTLSFPFPYEGTTYTDVYVGTNGAIQLGDLGDDSDIDYDMWNPSYLDEFYDDGGFPVLAVFNTDFDLDTNGTIHFKDFGNRAVITWNEVGTYEEKEHLASFQIQLFADGRIYFSYNGILDGVGEDLVTSLDQGILVGISGSTGVDPGPVDLSETNDTATDTVYEVWAEDAPPENSLFDLDQKTLVFAPKAGGGFRSYILQPTPLTKPGRAIPDLLIGKTAKALRGNGIRNPNRPSPRQTIEYVCGIFKTNTSTAILLLQNDGGKAAKFRLRSSGDRFPRMDVSARASVGGNVAAAIRTGRFSPTIKGGASVRVVYRLRTDRYYAGVLRGGDRHDTVRFRLSGAGLKDTAAMTNRYR